MFELVGVHGPLTLVRGLTGERAELVADKRTTLFRHGAHAIKQRANFLVLLGSHMLPGFHAAQDALLLVGRKRIEFLQTLLEAVLTIGGKILKVRIVLEGLFLLLRRRVQVAAQPLTEV